MILAQIVEFLYALLPHAINMAIAYGLVYLGGCLFGQSPKEAEDEPRGESFAWDPHTTHQEGIPRPECFGRNQHHGNVVMRWSDVDPVSGNEILFKALDYGGGPVQGMDVVGGIISDDDKCLEGTAEFFIRHNENISDWYQTAGDVNDDDKTTFVGFYGKKAMAILKGRFESIVTFAEAPTINRVEYIRHWHIYGDARHQGFEKVYLWYAGADDWDLISTKNMTTEGADTGTVVIEAGGPWKDVTKVKIEVELSTFSTWGTSKRYATVTYKLYELRTWHLEDVPVYLNDQPAHNFTEAIVRGRLGTLNQTCMKGFEKNKLQYGPETTVVYGEPVRWTTPNKFGDDIEFTLAWLRGLYHYADDGGIKPHGVGVLVEIKERDAENWNPVPVLETTVSAHQLKALFKAYRVNELVPGTVEHGKQYDLRFSKTTEEYSPGRFGDEVQLRSIREVINVAFTHPGRALLGVIVQATERLQGNVDVKWVTNDKLVQVYDKETEEWPIEFSRNRAYVDLAIRTQPVISGDGSVGHPWDVVRYDGLQPSRIDLIKWYEWALWCDVQVASGLPEPNHEEDRMPCDIICDRLTNVWSIAYEIAQIGRMYPYWQGCILTGWIDNETTEPIDLITMDNVMANSWKNAWAGYGEMAGSAKIFYKDAQQGYARKPRPVHNKNAGLYTRIIGLEGVGVTSESLATRVGNHVLKRNELIKNINSVRMGREALRYRLGRVVRIQSKIPNWGQAFRVITSPTTRTVQLDRVVENVAENDLFWVKTAHATTKVVSNDWYTVDSVAGKVVTIKEEWVAGRRPLKDHFAAIGIDGSIKLRRIVKMQPAQDNYFDVELETYNADPATGLFTSDNEDPVLTNPDYVQPVTELATLMSRQAVIDLINSLAPPSPKFMKPQLFNCDWSGNEVDKKVFWSKLNPDEPILLTWQGETYEIAPSPDPAGTTLEFIYWDFTNPEEFQVTGAAAAALAPGMYLMCTNKDGVAHPADATQTQHGAIIQIGTLIAEQIIIGGINALGLMNAPAEAGADSTGGRLALIASSMIPNWRLDLVDADNRPAGIYPTDYIVSYDQLGWLTGDKAEIKILSTPDPTAGYGFPAMPIDDKQLYEIFIRHKSSAASTDGLYLRFQEWNAALPLDKTHIGYQGGANTQDRITQSSLVNNVAMPGTDWVVDTFTYTPTAGTKYASFSMMNYNPDTAGVEYHVDYVLMRLVPKDADQIAESATNKWAGESGADVTGSHEADIALANLGEKSLTSLTNKSLANVDSGAATKLGGVENGADVTGAHQGDIDLHNLDEKLVDSLVDGDYAKMLAVWKHADNPAQIDLSKGFAASITTAQIGLLAVHYAQIDNLAVGTIKIIDNAVTDSAFVLTEAEIAAVNETVIQTLEFTTTGQSLYIVFMAPGKQSGGYCDFYLRLYRGEEKIRESFLTSYVGYWMPVCTMMAEDSPGPGNYTYTVTIEEVRNHITVKERALRISEFKK